MTSTTVELESRELWVEIDLGRGAEVSRIRDQRTGIDLLMRTPWHRAASRIRPTSLVFPVESSADSWMASYAGGWQVLFPHAGKSETVDGVPRPYHGEASIVPWSIDQATPISLRASTELITVPVAMTREYRLSGSELVVSDTIRNRADLPIEFDYVHHPTLSEEFLGEDGTILTNAGSYTPAPEVELGEFEPGKTQPWPIVQTVAGESTDLSQVPRHDETRMRFGWLADFGSPPSARFASKKRDLAVTLVWFGSGFDKAWFWQEAHAHTGYPWFGRGYAMAIEPSTTTTGGHSRSRQVLMPHAEQTFEVRLIVGPTDKENES